MQLTTQWLIQKRIVSCGLRLSINTLSAVYWCAGRGRSAPMLSGASRTCPPTANEARARSISARDRRPWTL
ncbi:hypothetical protein B0O95_10922 [Mycetohabitans endofungorum]|uniref:Uncharacterized protein n=1 Tax=Mycetohabitans endofungorum TaxID=417203 RepID=A0A2P5K913_9BURK|nr:hypothetical protein B0O95_10922 [Mycetohabitans endofungorum]